MNILKIVICFCVWIFCFFQLGYLVNVIVMKRKEIENYAEQLVIGFLSYFSLFQIIAFPMILLKMKLSSLTRVWGVIVVAILILPLFLKNYKGLVWKKKTDFNIVLFIAIFLVVCQIFYAVFYPYFGWDTLSYVGRINASLETDTMFLYSGDEGIPHPYLNFKHALSAFYMNSSVFCQIFHLSGFLFQKYVGGSICVLFSYLVFYIVIVRICDRKTAAWALVFLSLLRFSFSGVATTDTFLLTRSYEAKAYCGNIVLPLIFGICIMLWRDYNDEQNWKLLFLTVLSSLPISMSAIVSAPLLIICMIVPLFIVEFDKVILKRMIICLLPNAVWCFLYLLYFLKIIRIQGVMG